MKQIHLENEVLKVESIDKEKRVWKWLSRFGGILGIIATAFVVHQNIFTEPDVSAYLLGSSGDRHNMDQAKYLFWLKINVAEKDLLFKNIKVRLTYQGGHERVGKLINPNAESINKWSFGNLEWKLNIPHYRLFHFQSVLTKNESHIGYIAVLADSMKAIKKIRPISIQVVFEGSENKFLSSDPKIFKTDEITYTVSFFDHEVWIPISDHIELITNEFGYIESKINEFVVPEKRDEFYVYFEGFILYMHDKLKPFDKVDNENIGQVDRR
jgi:hypothetical protein